MFYSSLVYSSLKLVSEREAGCAQQFLCAFQNNRNAPAQIQDTYTHAFVSGTEEKDDPED